VGADAWVLMQRTGRWHCLLGFEAAPRNTTARSSEVVRPAAHARRTTTPPCKSRALASGAAAQGNRGKRACSSWIEMNEFLWSPPWRRTADAPARALTCAALRRRRRRASDWATVEGEQRPRRKAPARAISSPSMAVAIRRDAHTRSTHHHRCCAHAKGVNTRRLRSTRVRHVTHATSCLLRWHRESERQPQ